MRGNFFELFTKWLKHVSLLFLLLFLLLLLLTCLSYLYMIFDHEIIVINMHIRICTLLSYFKNMCFFGKSDILVHLEEMFKEILVLLQHFWYKILEITFS